MRFLRASAAGTWTPEQKREIVAESLGPELTPSEVARKYAISSGLLYTWRQQILGGQAARGDAIGTQLCAGGTGARAAVTARRADRALQWILRRVASDAVAPDGLIEIVLPDGVLRAGRCRRWMAGRLRRVLGALQGR